MLFEYEYDVLSCQTKSELILEVRDRILQGWVPVGGMVIGTDYVKYQTSSQWKLENSYYQTMTHQRRLPGT